MSQLAQLKAKLATLDKILVEAKAERRRAEDLLGSWEDRESRRSARQRQNIEGRFPALGGGR